MRRVLAIAVAAVVAACSESAAPRAATHVGSYPLRSINGHLPPQVVSDDGDATESIVGGRVILSADQTYVDSTEVQVVVGSSVTYRHDVARGNYRLSNDSVFFGFQGQEYVMVRDGAELIQDFAGIELVYRR